MSMRPLSTRPWWGACSTGHPRCCTRPSKRSWKRSGSRPSRPSSTQGVVRGWWARCCETSRPTSPASIFRRKWSNRRRHGPSTTRSRWGRSWRGWESTPRTSTSWWPRTSSSTSAPWRRCSRQPRWPCARVLGSPSPLNAFTRRKTPRQRGSHRETRRESPSRTNRSSLWPQRSKYQEARRVRGPRLQESTRCQTATWNGDGSCS
mmetsp:Transcript_50675/g.120682  ORF Transcript_50675/g.120682 Transcript_50675/m.120682 type:complete len:205 (-) Transcript_50675:236-850(-)